MLQNDVPAVAGEVAASPPDPRRKLRLETNDRGAVRVSLIAGEDRDASGGVRVSSLGWIPALFAAPFAQWYREAATIRHEKEDAARVVVEAWQQRLPGARKLGAGQLLQALGDQLVEAQHDAVESAHMVDEEVTSVSPDRMRWLGFEVAVVLAAGLVEFDVSVVDGHASATLTVDEQAFAGRLVVAIRHAVGLLQDALRPDRTKGGVA